MADQEATVPLQVSFSLIEKTLQEEFTRHFTNYKSGLVLSDPGGFVLTPEYAEVAEKIYNLPLRPDDAWVVTFPKCGKCWFATEHSDDGLKINHFSRHYLDTGIGLVGYTWLWLWGCQTVSA